VVVVMVVRLFPLDRQATGWIKPSGQHTLAT